MVRRASSGETRIDIKADVDSEVMVLPVDADIEEGDRVDQQLLNGKTRTLIITTVDVLQSPCGSLDVGYGSRRWRVRHEPARLECGATLHHLLLRSAQCPLPDCTNASPKGRTSGKDDAGSNGVWLP